MATTAIRSIKIVRESTFGSLSSTTLEPDGSVFDNAVELDCVRAGITPFGDAPANERDEVRSTFGDVCPEPETIPRAADGLAYQLRRGDVSLSIYAAGIGTLAPDSNPLFWILDAGWTPAVQPDNAGENAQSNVAAQVFEVDDGEAWDLGQLISITRLGKKAEFSSIVKITDAVIEHSPAFSAEADAGPSRVRPCRTWSSNPGTLGASLAIQIEGDGFRVRAYGIRPSALAITATGRRCMFDFTMSAAIVTEDPSVALLAGTNIGAPPLRSGGWALHTLGAEVVISDVIDEDDAAYPRIPGRFVPEVDSWTMQLTNELDAVGAGMSSSVLGMSEWEVTKRSASCSFTVDARDAGEEFAADYHNRRHRQVMFGMGPGGADGSGACVQFPRAFLTADPNKRNVSGPRTQLDLNYGAGIWTGDDGTATTAANAAFRIGFVDGVA
jgi:hypothetical protein